MHDCVYTQREGVVARGNSVMYDIYCPTRVSMADAERIGRDLVAGHLALNDRGYDPIREEADHAQLVPAFQDVPHRFEYACVRDGKTGVATHIKVRVLETRPDAWRYIGWSCQFDGGQNGGLARGRRMDREYHCQMRYRPSDGHDLTMRVAQYVMQRDMLPEADRLNLKICVTAFTDFQCAPCETSDKLVVRVLSVGKHDRCPQGAIPAD